MGRIIIGLLMGYVITIAQASMEDLPKPPTMLLTRKESAPDFVTRLKNATDIDTIKTLAKDICFVRSRLREQKIVIEDALTLELFIQYAEQLMKFQKDEQHASYASYSALKQHIDPWRVFCRMILAFSTYLKSYETTDPEYSSLTPLELNDLFNIKARSLSAIERKKLIGLHRALFEFLNLPDVWTPLALIYLHQKIAVLSQCLQKERPSGEVDLLHTHEEKDCKFMKKRKAEFDTGMLILVADCLKEQSPQKLFWDLTEEPLSKHYPNLPKYSFLKNEQRLWRLSTQFFKSNPKEALYKRHQNAKRLMEIVIRKQRDAMILATLSSPDTPTHSLTICQPWTYFKQPIKESPALFELMAMIDACLRNYTTEGIIAKARKNPVSSIPQASRNDGKSEELQPVNQPNPPHESKKSTRRSFSFFPFSKKHS